MTPLEYSKSFQHIKLLPTIIFAFFDSVNAFKENEGASNPVIEAVFDLMVTVLIPLILFDKNESLKKVKLFNYISEDHLKIIQMLPVLTISSLVIWFCVNAYHITHDFFFIAYLIAKLVYNLVKIITNLIILPLINVKFRFIYIIYLLIYVLNGTIDFIFLSLAVRRNYVDNKTFSFVLVPIIIAFLIEIVIFVCNIRLEDKAKDEKGEEAPNNKKASENEETSKTLDNIVVENAPNDEELKEKAPNDEELKERAPNSEKLKEKDEINEEEFERQGWISVFCSSLMICTITGPSVLWIKAYITLGLIAYMIEELIKKLKNEKKKANRQN
jgi:hypothetical protein